ncbi:hypothetical protein MMC10_005054 [Thelotrema lepadinum]|nr:hypothetical protein [Thelotrema lepadinum]
MKAAKILSKRIENMLNILKIEPEEDFERISSRKSDDSQQGAIEIKGVTELIDQASKGEDRRAAPKEMDLVDSKRHFPPTAMQKKGEDRKGDDSNFKGNAQGWL